MKISKFIARQKIYMDRSRTYLSYIQLFILFKLFLSDIGIEDNKWLIVGFIVSIAIMLIVGYLDTKLGIRTRELEDYSYKNPVMMDILNTLKRIEDENKRDNTDL